MSARPGGRLLDSYQLSLTIAIVIEIRTRTTITTCMPIQKRGSRMPPF